MSTDKIIKIIDLTKIYKMGDVQVTALDKISIEIENGEFVAIMGPSGSGKSTLLNILGCLDRPTSGQYTLAGEDVSRLSREKLARVRNQKIGFVFQSYNLLAQSNALENVMLPMVYSRNGSRRSRKERLERARTALETVGLENRERHKPTEMSGGQQQRVAIARALINDPPLILADEPTGNLDTHSGQEIMEVLDELNRLGRTIVMVTHEAEIALHAKRTIHVRDGHIEIIQTNHTHTSGDPTEVPDEAKLIVDSAGGSNETD
jgi:putative ABC transport system ATP-binding protein